MKKKRNFEASVDFKWWILFSEIKMLVQEEHDSKQMVMNIVETEMLCWGRPEDYTISME